MQHMRTGGDELLHLLLQTVRLSDVECLLMVCVCFVI